MLPPLGLRLFRPRIAGPERRRILPCSEPVPIPAIRRLGALLSARSADWNARRSFQISSPG